MARPVPGALRCVRGTKAMFAGGCFGMRMASRSRGALPELCWCLAPLIRSKGAGKTGCRIHPRSRVCSRARTGWTTGTPVTRPSLRDGFHGVLRALLGERCTIAPVALRLSDARAGRPQQSPQDLTPEPRAPGPHDFSVRAHPRWVLHGWRALTVKAMRGRCQRRVAPRRSPLAVARPAASSRADAVAATASRPASRDDRETPLVAGGMADIYGKTEFL